MFGYHFIRYWKRAALFPNVLHHPLELKRTHFQVKFDFCITINKSQRKLICTKSLLFHMSNESKFYWYNKNIYSKYLNHKFWIKINQEVFNYSLKITFLKSFIIKINFYKFVRGARTVHFKFNLHIRCKASGLILVFV
jgi:hypothetical protein